MGKGTDCARDGTGSDLVAGRYEPHAGAHELCIGVSKLEPERGWLCMDAVAAADGQRVLVLESAPFQRGKQSIHIGYEQIGGLHQLNVEAGVEHVRGGHATVEETRLWSDVLSDVCQKGDDVVLDLGLDLVDAVDVKAPALLHRLGDGFRDQPKLGHGLSRKRLDLEPDAKLGLRLPNASHVGAAVAGDHARNPFLRISQVS